MTSRLTALVAALLLLMPVAVQAQATGTGDVSAARREQAIARREAAAQRRQAMQARREARRSLTPAERRAAREARAARIAAMPPEQQAFMTAMTTYRRGLRAEVRSLQAQVAAGTLTRDAMAKQLAAYRAANRPARPAGMPARTRPGA